MFISRLVYKSFTYFLNCSFSFLKKSILDICLSAIILELAGYEKKASVLSIGYSSDFLTDSSSSSDSSPSDSSVSPELDSLSTLFTPVSLALFIFGAPFDL